MFCHRNKLNREKKNNASNLGSPVGELVDHYSTLATTAASKHHSKVVALGMPSHLGHCVAVHHTQPQSLAGELLRCWWHCFPVGCCELGAFCKQNIVWNGAAPLELNYAALFYPWACDYLKEYWGITDLRILLGILGLLLCHFCRNRIEKWAIAPFKTNRHACIRSPVLTRGFAFLGQGWKDCVSVAQHQFVSDTRIDDVDGLFPA